MKKLIFTPKKKKTLILTPKPRVPFAKAPYVAKRTKTLRKNSTIAKSLNAC